MPYSSAGWSRSLRSWLVTRLAGGCAWIWLVGWLVQGLVDRLVDELIDWLAGDTVIV